MRDLATGQKVLLVVASLILVYLAVVTIALGTDLFDRHDAAPEHSEVNGRYSVEDDFSLEDLEDAMPSIDNIYYLEESLNRGFEELLVEIAGGQDAYDEVMGPESPWYNPNVQAAARSMYESMESSRAVELVALREELGLDVLRPDTPTPSEEPKGDGTYVVGDEISTGTWILDGFAQGADDAGGSNGYVELTGCEWSLIDSDGNTLHTYSRSRAHIPNYAHTFTSTDCGTWVLQVIGNTAQTPTAP